MFEARRPGDSYSSVSRLTVKLHVKDGLCRRPSTIVEHKVECLKGLGPSVVAFVEGLAEETSSHVAIARDGKKTVGFFRFTIRRGTLWAQGTWVRKSYRKKGLALSMWDVAMKRFKPKRVDVVTVSRGGKVLVERVKRGNPGVKFAIDAR